MTNLLDKLAAIPLAQAWPSIRLCRQEPQLNSSKWCLGLKVCFGYTHNALDSMCQVLLELARNRNKTPLPKPVGCPGIPLPPEEDTLISPNYQLVIPNKQPSQAPEEKEEEEEAAAAPSSSQELKTDMPQNIPQRVSLPVGPKCSKWRTVDQC